MSIGSRKSDYAEEQLRDDLATVLDERVETLEYLHSSDLVDDVLEESADGVDKKIDAKRVGRNIVEAAESAGLHIEKWAHNGVSTTWLVEDRDDDQEADR